MPRHFHVLLNARSGTALTTGVTPETLERLFSGAGHTAIIDADIDAPMAKRLERLRRSPAEIVVAAGGDGTVTAVAGAIVDTEKTLAILPLGTVNLLARDLGVPLDLDRWVATVDAMAPRRMDVGEVNGQIFLHKVVAGFVPALAAGREQLRGNSALRAKIGYLQFFFRRLFRSRRMAVEITDASGATRIARVVAMAVANNEYDEGLGRFFARTELDRGTLSLYLLKHLSFSDLVRLVTEMLLGNWRQDEALEIETARRLTLRTRKRTLKVMLDGEVQSLSVPLQFRIRPAALSVLAPVPVEVAPPVQQPADVEG